MNYPIYMNFLSKNSRKLRFVIVYCILLSFFSCGKKLFRDKKLKETDLISTNGNQFIKGDQPYYFVGANYWYGAILGSKKLGDRKRLIKELDLMKSLGIDNLRILVGAEGLPRNSKVSPALQPKQGIYNEALLDGLDFLLFEMNKREMYAILYMTNNWIWSGGMSQYLEWNGYGEVPNPFLDQFSWEDYMSYTVQFYNCKACKDAYYNHIKFIMGRTNPYKKIPYVQDNTIMSWQIANEPRVMVSKEYEKPYKDWVDETVDLIESLDSVHLISTGVEGKESYFQDITVYKEIHSNPKIDYLTMHMWPKNWGWYDSNNEKESTNYSIDRANDYMNEHIKIANEIKKPIVMEEFGFPRDSSSIKPISSTKNRFKFYKFIIEKVTESALSKDAFAGLNFWGFGGFATKISNDGVWRLGDDFTADPPQEPQGLNTIFASDEALLNLIRGSNLRINKTHEK